MSNRCTNPNDTNRYRLWARRILCCYPRAWRERYEREMEQVLLSHAVTFWTLIDLLLGALDARLHELHSYETPEFLVLDLAAASQPYLDWLQSSLRLP